MGILSLNLEVRYSKRLLYKKASIDMVFISIFLSKLPLILFSTFERASNWQIVELYVIL